MNEINLIGGFYKSKSLPFSAQDVVNWLPVPAKSEAARSPIKLRGLPGLKPLSESVVEALRIIGDAPDGNVSEAYSFAYSAAGGTPPYSYSFVSGSLPAGLAFASGAISGTPTTVETDFFTVRVTDSSALSAEKNDGIAITSASGLWILFAKPSSGFADQYSVTSTTPFSFVGAKRPAVVGGFAENLEISGYGDGWLYAAKNGNIPIRSSDLGVTWSATGFSSAGVQQRIDVRAGRVIVSRASSTQYSDDNGATATTVGTRAWNERYLFNAAEGVGGDRSLPDIQDTTNNATSIQFISGFPTFGREVVNLCAGTTHIVAAGASDSPANRFSRVSISTPRAAHTPFTVGAVSSSATWFAVSPSIAYGNSIFVMVTDQGQIVRSTDEGASWSVSAFTFPSPRSLVFGDGVFLICGAAGAIYTSTDGNTWTLRSSGTFATDDITNAIYIP